MNNNLQTIFNTSLISNLDNSKTISKDLLEKNTKSLENKKIDLTKTQNKNTQLNDTCFPALEGMPEPNQAIPKDIKTNTGNGGAIVNKSYTKSAAFSSLEFENSLKNNTFKNPFGEIDNRWYSKKNLTNTFNNYFTKLKDFSDTNSNQGALKSTLAHALIGTIIGGLGGVGYNIYDKFKANPTSQGLFSDILKGTLAGLFSGGLYGYLKHRHNDHLKKYSSYRKKIAFAIPSYPFINNNLYTSSYTPSFNNDKLNVIINKIMSDNNLQFNQKNELVNYIKQQPNNSIEDIYKLVTVAAGSGIGYLISNYLLGMGKTGNILFSILGGLIANRYNKPSNVDKPYNPILEGYKDIFGNSL